MKDYDGLRQFAEVAATLHFGRAARACHLSPSALSRAIQRLESELGDQLFEREHHQVSLTPAGEAFRRHANAVLAEWQRFEAERATSGGALSGTLHVYCTVTAAQSLVPDLLASVRETHPGIRVQLATGYATDAIERLRGGDIDVSVAAVPTRLPAGIVSQRLATTPLVFVAPSAPGPVADAVRRRPVDWSVLPLVLPAHGLAREYTDQWLAGRAVTPTVYAEIEGHEAILSLVALGCGVGVLPKLVVDNSALRHRVTEVPSRPALRPFHLGLCIRERSLANPLVAAVWERAFLFGRGQPSGLEPSRRRGTGDRRGPGR
jgi:LysR family positive regulator for ilvC